MIRRPNADDHAQWDALYAGYADFYGVPQTAQMRARVWGWIHDPAHPVTAWVAQGPDGRLTGLAHVRAFSRPLASATGGYLDDLFVDPSARGQGTARALLDAIAAEGRAQGWGVIRWITAADNARARALYDQVAQATQWVTYDMTL